MIAQDKTQTVSDSPTDDTIIKAPLQRPLQPFEELPQLSLGASDYVEKKIVANGSIKRRNSTNECYSILGFLNRRVKLRGRLASEDLPWPRKMD